MDEELTEKLYACLKDDLAVLDGGFATHIEDVLNQDVSSSPLWSASLLRTDSGQDAIRQTHVDFLAAGAQIISTSTYQASLLSLRLAGIDKETSGKLIVRSVELAEEARQQYAWGRTVQHWRTDLNSVCQDTGRYFVPDDPDQRTATVKDMSDFHLDRLMVVAQSAAWNYIDLLAFETIPRLDEAHAIRDALQRLYQDTGCERKPAYVCFVFPNGEHLPFVAVKAQPSSIEDILRATLGVFEGIGINCTKPHMLLPLVRKLNTGLQALRTDKAGAKPFLFLYPDGGLVWNGLSRQWEGSTTANQKRWSEVVLEAADCATSSSDWAGCFVGGCCKATVEDIKDLRRTIDDRHADRL